MSRINFLLVSALLFIASSSYAQFGGIIMYDMAYYSTNDSMDALFPGHAEDGTEFRRVRIYSKGDILSNLSYKIQLDVAGGDVDFKDVYMEFSEVPVLGNLRVGQMKEPFRLEALTSSKYLTFMERALPINLQPERNSGIMVHNSTQSGNISWALGVFRNANGYGDAKEANGKYNFTGRLTYVHQSGKAIQSKTEEEQKNMDPYRLFHFGGGVSLRNPNGNEYGISARPESHLAEKYFNTGSITNVDNLLNLGLEMGLVLNNLSIQGEYVNSKVNTTDGANDQTLSGYYAYVSYFLSGAQRPYKGGTSGFDRVKPQSKVGDGGKGAWEIGLRYSSLSSSLDSVGDLNGITIGLNWYLNNNARIMSNYVLSTLKDTSGGDNAKSNALQFRFQLDF